MLALAEAVEAETEAEAAARRTHALHSLVRTFTARRQPCP